VRIVRAVRDLREWRRSLEGTVGLVPTMGALHEGHLSLVRAARSADDHVVVSIFVNPRQFGPEEDFARYPRDEARDCALLEDLRVDAVFAPSVEEMYPPGFSTSVEVAGLTAGLEGDRRPGHFRGVTTVVARLFNLAAPDRAYFGEKDAQQLAVIRRMVADLGMTVEVVGMPTVREPDGLALSSRNVYLSDEQRRAATVLSRALADARALWDGGERDAAVVRESVLACLRAEPLAEVDYASVADAETLDECRGRVARPALVSLAVRFGNTRLIDNVTLAP
jgi:pantoate--beta-alanine ligase